MSLTPDLAHQWRKAFDKDKAALFDEGNFIVQVKHYQLRTDEEAGFQTDPKKVGWAFSDYARDFQFSSTLDISFTREQWMKQNIYVCSFLHPNNFEKKIRKYVRIVAPTQKQYGFLSDNNVKKTCAICCKVAYKNSVFCKECHQCLAADATITATDAKTSTLPYIAAVQAKPEQETTQSCKVHTLANEVRNLISAASLLASGIIKIVTFVLFIIINQVKGWVGGRTAYQPFDLSFTNCKR